MPARITQYRASQYFRWAGFVALAIALFSAWVAFRWPYAWIAAGLSLASATAVFLVAFGPRIEIYESHLKIGNRGIPWAHIRRLDRRFPVPLIVRLSLADKRRVLLIHAGDSDSCHSLLRQLRRNSREALIDGIPHKQFWGELPRQGLGGKQAGPPRPLLLPDDEAEVERLFQRLKSVGHIDPKGSSEEK
ncbi:MAG: hypothetical protein ACR2NN_09520 [Bryobacteraceae bacterium]